MDRSISAHEGLKPFALTSCPAHISLRFVPVKLELDEEKLTADISGYLASYVGVKQTENAFVKYRLGFEYQGGVLTLIEYKELTKDGME